MPSRMAGNRRLSCSRIAADGVGPLGCHSPVFRGPRGRHLSAGRSRSTGPVWIEHLEDIVADPSMPNTGALAQFSDDVLLGEQAQEVHCPRLAEAEVVLDVSDSENRVSEEQVHNFGATAPATSELCPIGLPKI